MGKNVRSVMKFENYIVKKAIFEYNIEYEENEEGIDINFDIDVDFDIDSEEGELLVFLKTIIFDEPTKNNYPFRMEIELVGAFTMVSGLEKDVNFFKANAVAILFPYVRALVSSYTANANVEPLILPTINVNRYLQDKNEIH